MDPITTAIVAALPALGAELFKDSIKDAYEGLKALIRRKWGDQSSIAKSMDALEENPKSKARAKTLSKKVIEADATSDPQVLKALAILADALAKEGLGPKAITPIKTTITGGNVTGVIGASNVSIGNMNIGEPRRPKR